MTPPVLSVLIYMNCTRHLVAHSQRNLLPCVYRYVRHLKAACPCTLHSLTCSHTHPPKVTFSYQTMAYMKQVKVIFPYQDRLHFCNEWNRKQWWELTTTDCTEKSGESWQRLTVQKHFSIAVHHRTATQQHFSNNAHHRNNLTAMLRFDINTCQLLCISVPTEQYYSH